MSKERREEKKRVAIPIGGILLALCSGGLFAWSSAAKSKARKMEESSEHTPETLLKHANNGDYVCVSGSLQPLEEGGYIETAINKRKTVLYFRQYIQKVRITRRSESVSGRSLPICTQIIFAFIK